jgi:peroxiredoxin
MDLFCSASVVGEKPLLFILSKDNTPDVPQACSFRDNMKISKICAEVIGISSDGRFSSKISKQYKLPFIFYRIR